MYSRKKVPGKLSSASALAPGRCRGGGGSASRRHRQGGRRCTRHGRGPGSGRTDKRRKNKKAEYAKPLARAIQAVKPGDYATADKDGAEAAGEG
ncbi:hypothetical protein ACRAWD_15730 [Caulobacter segnis]